MHLFTRLERACLTPFSGADYVVRRKAEALFRFSLALIVLLVAGLVFYAAAAPQRLPVAAPPMLAGVAVGLANLALLRGGRFGAAAVATAVAAAGVLAAAQALKLRADLHLAYSSFAFFYLLPPLVAGLFCRRRLVLVLAAVMLAVNVAFYWAASRSPSPTPQVRESLAVGFISSSLVLALGAVLLFYLRRIMDHALDDITSNNRSMERFVPFGFVRALGKSSVGELELGDHVREVMTVMFCDLRDFTPLAERSGDAETFALLNRYFGVMGPLIRDHGGFIDKYVGDAIMAVFPTARQALAAALAMQDALASFNRTHGTGLDFGIGMDTGTLSLGAVGESRRIEGTVISDTVNTASRIEGLTRQFGSRILLSGRAVDELQEPGLVEFLKTVQVKGRARPVRVFRPAAGQN